MCCLKTLRAQIFIVTSVFSRCFLDKRAHGLESGKIFVYCWFAADVTVAMLDDRNKAFSAIGN